MKTYRAPAKVNIFLKITGKLNNYHTIASRFIIVKHLYDIIKFEKGIFDRFTLIGDFGCKIEHNTIYKAYLELSKISHKVTEYFKYHNVKVDKNIPEFAGLGGGSSDCATFILMVNDVCDLKLSKNELSKIGAKIGADVPFFIYEYDSANVQGVGDIVGEFIEDIPKVNIVTPNIKCNTTQIFKIFRNNFYKESTKNEINKLFKMKSIDILDKLLLEDANDLYLPASYLNNSLKIENLSYNNKKLYFSGSGSSFFYINRKD